MGGDPIGLIFIGLALHGCAKKRHPPRQKVALKTALNSGKYSAVLTLVAIAFSSTFW
jgi:hypothetical protein